MISRKEGCADEGGLDMCSWCCEGRAAWMKKESCECYGCCYYDV